MLLITVRTFVSGKVLISRRYICFDNNKGVANAYLHFSWQYISTYFSSHLHFGRPKAPRSITSLTLLHISRICFSLMPTKPFYLWRQFLWSIWDQTASSVLINQLNPSTNSIFFSFLTWSSVEWILSERESVRFTNKFSSCNVHVDTFDWLNPLLSRRKLYIRWFKS